MGVDGVPACAFAEDGDLRGVAAECVDVLLYPVECEALVQEAEIAFCERKFCGAWEPEDWSMSIL
jgi:hypothetical protein